jgi:putative transposase
MVSEAWARLCAQAQKKRQGRLGDTWHIDEVFIPIQCQGNYLWRTVDQDGDMIDILVQRPSNKKAAERFSRGFYLKARAVSPVG